MLDRVQISMGQLSHIPCRTNFEHIIIQEAFYLGTSDKEAFYSEGPAPVSLNTSESENSIREFDSRSFIENPELRRNPHRTDTSSLAPRSDTFFVERARSNRFVHPRLQLQLTPSLFEPQALPTLEKLEKA